MIGGNVFSINGREWSLKITVLLSVIFTLFLTSCGNDDDDKSEKTSKRRKAPENPKKPETTVERWDRAGKSFLGQESDTTVRALGFTDGLFVVYDGSAETGDEKVCRRELVVRSSQRWYYEVCMELVDDPYFAPEVNFFIGTPFRHPLPGPLSWYPLMFTRFASELTCYIYSMGAERSTSADDVDCVSDVYPKMGGDDFSCEAGLVNGDKALRCSDDWGVVVNGYYADTKSVCRVLLTDSSGRCLGAPINGVEDRELILKMQESSWEGYRSEQKNPEQFAPGDSAPPLAPRGLPTGAALDYTSVDEDFCSVNNNGVGGKLGTVTIAGNVVPPAVCRIEMRVEARGYADWLLFVELPILKTSDVEWEPYRRSNNYFYIGETLAAGAVLSTDPATVETAYKSLNKSICTVNEQDGTVTAKAAGECTIQLTVTAEDYLDVVIERSVRVDRGRQNYDSRITVGWTDFPSAAVVGVDTAALAAPTVIVSGGGSLDISDLQATVSPVSGECSYDQTNRVISFAGVEECVLAVTISGRRSHNDKVVQFRVTPTPGTLSLTWTGYANSNQATYNSDAPALVAPVLSGTLTGVSYRYSASGRGCQVDTQSGALTLLGADRVRPSRGCRVTLTASREDYTDATINVDVTIAKQTQEAPTVPTAPYGALVSLQAGQNPAQNQPLINVPTGEGEGLLTYSGPSDTTICTVNAGNGLVTAGSSIGSCVINILWSGDDNTNPSAEVTLATIAIVTSANTATPAWHSSPYGGDVAVGTAASIANVITGSGDGALEYDSTTPEHCSVNSSSGRVTGFKVGDCILRARFVGDSSAAASAWERSPIVRIVKGSALPRGLSEPYGFSPEVKVEGRLPLKSDLRKYFGNPTFSIATATRSNCEVYGSGAVRGLRVGDCTVRASFAGNANYNAIPAEDLQTIRVVKGDKIIIFSGVYGLNPFLSVDGTLSVSLGGAPIAMMGSTPGGNYSYYVKSGSESYCSVDPSDGTITGLAPGECVIQIRTVATAQYGVTTKDILSITVGKGNLASLSWAPESGSSYNPALGVALVLDPVDVRSLTGVTVTYEVKDAGDTGCTLTGTRTVTFEGLGTCVVTAKATKEHYRDWSRDHRIRIVRKTIPPPDTNPGFAMGATLPVGGAAAAPTVVSWNTPLPGLRYYWELIRGEKDCVLTDKRTGSVLAERVAIDPG